jgi:hypothetical protein
MLQMQEPVCPGEPAANPHVIVIAFEPHAQNCILLRGLVAGVPRRDEQCQGVSDQRPSFFLRWEKCSR